MAIPGTLYHITAELMQPMLGGAPKNKEIYTEHILSKVAGTEELSQIGQTLPLDELETVEELEDKRTGFHFLDGQPLLYDYVIKGFFKESWGGLRRIKKTKVAPLSAHVKIITAHFFPYPRRIFFEMPEGKSSEIGLFAHYPNPEKNENGEDKYLVDQVGRVNGNGLPIVERPLRAATARGERTALAMSEMMPEGTKINFDVWLLGDREKGPITEEMLREVFLYGRLKGLGQWRSSGWGRFKCEITADPTITTYEAFIAYEKATYA